MIDAYLADVLPETRAADNKRTGRYIPTIDLADGRCVTGLAKDLNTAKNELKVMKEKFKVKIVKDNRLKSEAPNAEERKWIYKCKLKKKPDKEKLLKSRKEGRRLTKEEMK